jgi:hypothetical protein
VGDRVAGSGVDERREGRVPPKHEHVDVQLVAEEILERWRVLDGRVVDLDRGNSLGGGDAFSLGGLEF